ncbi:3-deoxy-7-phosphoheptulonate synthase [Candidatus Gracilibacteria bacterium]|nr:3-deoxy-7-phosphoheptulonate synthase [Candidatus Gracilibacteria bacterium]
MQIIKTIHIEEAKPKKAAAYRHVSREIQAEDSTVQVGDVTFGAEKPVIIAGPCSIESKEQLLAIAKSVKASGAQMLRGGAFKPRTSPYSFQGLGIEGLQILKEVSDEIGIPTVSELTSIDELPHFIDTVDMLQIGARNMQNFDLLKKAAQSQKPILLKRGMSATLEEFLLAAEYILKEGNSQLVLCERGIRTFENSSRNILDLNSLALVRILSHLPIIADPSHAGGRRDLILPLSKAALAAGAQGLIIETHNDPEQALCDGKQSLTLDQFHDLQTNINQ